MNDRKWLRCLSIGGKLLAVVAALGLTGCKPPVPTPKGDAHENQRGQPEEAEVIQINDNVAVIARSYIGTHKGWRPEEYRINPTMAVDSDGRVRVTVVHQEDLKGIAPGGGRSVQLIIDEKKGEVINELAFQ